MEKKNKKNIKILILILCFIFILILSFFIGKVVVSTLSKGIKQITTPTTINYSIKDIYSESLQTKITDFIEKESTPKKLSSFTPEQFYKKLKSKFKIIKKIKWNFTQPKIAKLTINGVRPFCKINNKLILGNKKRLFDPFYFEQFNTENLNQVYLSQKYFNGKINLSVYNFFNKIPTQIWNKYHLNYHKDSEIILEKKDKKNSIQSFFLLENKNFFNFAKFDKAKLLIKNLKKDWGNRFFWKKIKLFDLRFGDRILYRPLNIKPLGRG